VPASSPTSRCTHADQRGVCNAGSEPAGVLLPSRLEAKEVGVAWSRMHARSRWSWGAGRRGLRPPCHRRKVAVPVPDGYTWDLFISQVGRASPSRARRQLLPPPPPPPRPPDQAPRLSAG
jgi:hypothetical protein